MTATVELLQNKRSLPGPDQIGQQRTFSTAQREKAAFSNMLANIKWRLKLEW